MRYHHRLVCILTHRGAIDNSLFSFPDQEPPSPSDTARDESSHAIFVPAPDAHEYSEAVNFRPPEYLLALVKNILNTPNAMDISTKQAETVDWGGEVDYSGYEWFKDPPPRPEVSLPFTWIPRASHSYPWIAPTAAHDGQLCASARRDRTERGV